MLADRNGGEAPKTAGEVVGAPTAMREATTTTTFTKHQTQEVLLWVVRPCAIAT